MYLYSVYISLGYYSVIGPLFSTYIYYFPKYNGDTNITAY